MHPDFSFYTSAIPWPGIEHFLPHRSKARCEVTLEGVTGIFACLGCSDHFFEICHRETRSGIQLRAGTIIHDAKKHFQYPDVFWKWIEMKPIPDIMPARVEDCMSS